MASHRNRSSRKSRKTGKKSVNQAPNPGKQTQNPSNENVAPNVTTTPAEVFPPTQPTPTPAADIVAKPLSSLKASSSRRYNDRYLSSLLSTGEFNSFDDGSTTRTSQEDGVRIVYVNLLVLAQALDPVASNAPAQMPASSVRALQNALDRAWDLLSTMGKAQTCSYAKQTGQLELNSGAEKVHHEDFAAELFGRISGAIAPQLCTGTVKRRHLQLLLSIGLNLKNFTELWGMQCSGDTATQAVNLFNKLLKSFQGAMSHLPFEDADCTFEFSGRSQNILGGYRQWVEAAAEDERLLPALQCWVKGAQEEEKLEKVPVVTAVITEGQVAGNSAEENAVDGFVAAPVAVAEHVSAVMKSTPALPTATEQLAQIIPADAVHTGFEDDSSVDLFLMDPCVEEQVLEEIEEANFDAVVCNEHNDNVSNAASAAPNDEAICVPLENDTESSAAAPGVDKTAGDAVDGVAEEEMSELGAELGEDGDRSFDAALGVEDDAEIEIEGSVVLAQDLSEIERSDDEVYDLVVQMNSPIEELPVDLPALALDEPAGVSLIISGEDELAEGKEKPTLVTAVGENKAASASSQSSDSSSNKQSESLFIRGMRAVGGVVATVAAAVKTIWGMMSRVMRGNLS